MSNINYDNGASDVELLEIEGGRVKGVASIPFWNRIKELINNAISTTLSLGRYVKLSDLTSRTHVIEFSNVSYITQPYHLGSWDSQHDVPPSVTVIDGDGYVVETSVRYMTTEIQVSFIGGNKSGKIIFKY